MDPVMQRQADYKLLVVEGGSQTQPPDPSAGCLVCVHYIMLKRIRNQLGEPLQHGITIFTLVNYTDGDVVASMGKPPVTKLASVPVLDTNPPSLTEAPHASSAGRKTRTTKPTSAVDALVSLHFLYLNLQAINSSRKLTNSVRADQLKTVNKTSQRQGQDTPQILITHRSQSGDRVLPTRILRGQRL